MMDEDARFAYLSFYFSYHFVKAAFSFHFSFFIFFFFLNDVLHAYCYVV